MIKILSARRELTGRPPVDQSLVLVLADDDPPGRDEPVQIEVIAHVEQRRVDQGVVHLLADDADLPLPWTATFKAEDGHDELMADAVTDPAVVDLVRANLALVRDDRWKPGAVQLVSPA